MRNLERSKTGVCLVGRDSPILFSLQSYVIGFLLTCLDVPLSDVVVK